MSATPAPRELVIAAFEAPRDRLVAAWGRQVPVLLLERLSSVPGLKARLAIEGMRPRASLRPVDAILEGEVTGGEVVRLRAHLLRGPSGTPLLAREESFGARELFTRLDALALDVAKALGAALPLDTPRPAPSTSFLALRDYLRAVDLTEETDLPLDLEDRRRKLEWLLLAVEADPSFRPAADALLEAGLRAHAKGLHDESRRALELLARLSPRDPRASYVLGELLLAEGAPDEAAAHFRRCLVRDPGHAAAALKLGILCDEEGDRESAKAHFRRAGEALVEPRVEALLLLGILCAEDGEREEAKAAFARAALLDPAGRVGDLARFELDRAERGLPIDRIILEGEGGPRALASAAAVTPGKTRAKRGRARGSGRRRKAG